MSGHDYAPGYDASNDPYIDASSGVLKNLLGIADASALDAAEADFSYLRAAELEQNPVPGHFDLPHLQAIHRRLFGDVYPWAGEVRTVDVTKGGTYFCHNQRIAPEFSRLSSRLAAEQNLCGLPADTFSDRVAWYLGEINLLHPFREGNGRAQRAFFSQLARQAGYWIAWEGMSQESMTAACITAVHANHLELAALIARNLSVTQGSRVQ